MNSRFMRMIEPRFRLCFIMLFLFSLSSFFINRWLAVAELVLVLLVYLQFRSSAVKRRKDILKYVENVMYSLDSAAKDSLINFPLPTVVLKLDTNEVIWCNSQFQNITGLKRHMPDVNLFEQIPGLDIHWILEGKTQSPVDIELNGRFYSVYGNMVRTEGENTGGSILITLYWIDITDLVEARRELSDSKQIVSILMIDNYEEVMKGINDTERSLILAEADMRVANWAEAASGILIRYERDKFILMFENKYLDRFISEKFSILDTIREVSSKNGLSITLSIGLGKDGQTLLESYKNAQLALEMALSRGGDQAVIRNRFSFEFFGGRSKELERHTKVKSRVMANAISELIKDSSSVLIMGHKSADNDSVGAAMGLVCIARKLGKNANIILNTQDNSAAELVSRITGTSGYEDIFISAEDAIVEADGNTLLIVVDTNRPSYVESLALLESVNKIAVIDHHRRAAEYIENAVLSFHEPYASSACELVAELLVYLVEARDIQRIEAESLLSGLVLDTKSFTMRTGVRTFEAAAFLRRAGADTVEIKRMQQNDLNTYVRRAEIVKLAKIYYDKIAIAAYNGTSDRVIAAQAADDLLNISQVQASFVLYREGNSTVVSARSLGTINVQLILEKLGGGGNLATAGAQVRGKSVDEVLTGLIEAIEGVLNDELTQN